MDELLFADPEGTGAATPEREADARDPEGGAGSEGTRADGEAPEEAEGEPVRQHPEDPEKDYVNISFSQGVHVRDAKKGEEVHVGWDGIHADSDKEHVHLDFGSLARMIREFRKDQA